MALKLIADSGPIHREVAGIRPEQHSHRILVVTHGSAATRRIEGDSPVLILTDVMLALSSATRSVRAAVPRVCLSGAASMNSAPAERREAPGTIDQRHYDAN